MLVERLGWALAYTRTMVTLEPKKTSTLHDLPYATRDRKCLHTWVINVTPSGLAHCLHRCTFCYAREAIYSDPGDRQKVYSNLPGLVARDLDRISLCPPVSISNTTDPCQDVPEVRGEVRKLVEVLMSYGVSFFINTKGDPGFLLDIPGFAAYEPKFVAVSIEGPPEILRVLSPAAPDFEARLGFVRLLSARGGKTSIRLDPVLVHVWMAIYGPQWLARLDELSTLFAEAGARHLLSSTGRIDKRPGRWRANSDLPSMWERIRRIIASRSCEVARAFEEEYCDRSESNSGFRLRRDLRVAFHIRARALFEARGMTYASCLELPASISDSSCIPHCEGLPIPFSRKGPDGRFHPIEGCTANCHVSCAGLAEPPCGQPNLAKPAPFKRSELTGRGLRNLSAL